MYGICLVRWSNEAMLPSKRTFPIPFSSYESILYFNAASSARAPNTFSHNREIKKLDWIGLEVSAHISNHIKFYIDKVGPNPSRYD